MIRLIPFVFLTLLVTSLPCVFAGPACSQKYWKTADCVQKCRSKWGWPGRMMGTDPWRNVMQKSGPSESWDAALAMACGTTTQISTSTTQPVVNVQTGTVTSSTSVGSTLSVSISVTSVTSPVGFAPTASLSSVSTEASTSTISSKSVASASASAPKETFTSPPAFVAITTRAPVNRTLSTPNPVPTTTTIPPAPTTTTNPPASTTTNAPASTAPPSPGGSGSTSSDDIEAYLSSHNAVRANHGASSLTWSDDLAAKAQQWANGCIFEHSGGSLGSFGENLAAGTGSGYSIQTAVKSWTDEVKDYNAANPNPSHFTQVVWKATTQVGCAVQSCDGIFDASFGKARYYVCEYSPAGNIIGRFAENVQA